MKDIKIEDTLLKVAKEECKKIDALAKENPERDGGRFSAGQRTALIFYMGAVIKEILRQRAIKHQLK